MRASQLLTGVLLACSATMATSQELDPSETLQAKALQSAKSAQFERTRAAVVAELRNAQASGQMQVVGEMAEAPVSPDEHTEFAERPKTRAQVRKELASWNATHKRVVGELNGDSDELQVGAGAATMPLTREQVKAELADWRRTHALVVGDRN